MVGKENKNWKENHRHRHLSGFLVTWWMFKNPDFLISTPFVLIKFSFSFCERFSWLPQSSFYFFVLVCIGKKLKKKSEVVVLGVCDNFTVWLHRKGEEIYFFGVIWLHWSAFTTLISHNDSTKNVVGIIDWDSVF